MFNRSHILSLAAVATIATVALATSASANQPINKLQGLQANPGLIKATTPIAKPILSNPALHLTNPGLHLINPSSPPSLPPAVAIKKPIDIDCVSFHHDCDHDHDHDHDHDWDHHHHWGFWWHQPHLGVIGYDTVTAAPVATAPVSAAVGTAATPAPCNCLTKRYLQDGSVLFTDLCTKEQAMATPDELRAQAQGVSPQAQ
jgi:hypothetical protein